MQIGGLSSWELIIILVIIVLLFGVGRISKIAGEVGSGIRAFKEGLRGDDKDGAATSTAASPTEPEDTTKQP